MPCHPRAPAAQRELWTLSGKDPAASPWRRTRHLVGWKCEVAHRNTHRLAGMRAPFRERPAPAARNGEPRRCTSPAEGGIAERQRIDVSDDPVDIGKCPCPLCRAFPCSIMAGVRSMAVTWLTRAARGSRDPEPSDVERDVIRLSSKGRRSSAGWSASGSAVSLHSFPPARE